MRGRRALDLLALGLLLGFIATLARFFYIQVVKGPALRAMAERTEAGRVSFLPLRGEILDRDGGALALSVPAVSLYARPELLDAEGRRRGCALLAAWGLGERCERLRARQRFVYVVRRVPRDRLGDGLEAWRRIPGLGWEEATARRYPNGSLAGQLLGFVGVDGQGLEGLERALDEELRAVVRPAEVFRDARRHLLLQPEEVEALVPRRRHVVLTLDTTLQAHVERVLAKGLARYGGRAAVALVVEVATGELLAAAVAPAFDPNEFRRYTPERWRPRFATDAYEPGSTVKPLLLAAALLAGRNLHEIVYAEGGRFLVDEHVITDDEPHGWLSLRNVVVRSSNIGAVKIGFSLDRERLWEAYRRFGFGEPVGVRLPGEARGILRPPSRWSRLDWAAASFGQGLSVSPLQLARAYLTLARGGARPRIHVVERIVDDATGRTVWQAEHASEPAFPGATTTFARVREVLQAVVEEGTGKAARIAGVAIGGKTGTAQKPDLERGGYRAGAYVAWFTGLLPVERPRWVVVVLVDEPEHGFYGGQVAAPIFREIAQVLVVREGLLTSRAPRSGDLPRVVAWSRRHVPEDEVPDLHGLPLREVGRLAARRGARIVAIGSGVVVRQEPAPGAPASRSWRVWLRTKGEEAT